MSRPRQVERGCARIARAKGGLLDGLIDQYLAGAGCRAAEHRKRYRSMPSLDAAIQAAAGARDANGLCESHQRRIGNRTLAVFASKLQAHKVAIRRCRSFSELHTLIGSLRIRRVGELAIYDTAARLSIYLGVEPTEVYLHAGTRAGAKALELPARRATISMSTLPKALRRLRADEVEDFLCIYKDQLQPAMS